MAFAFGDTFSRDTDGRVAMDAPVLMGDIEDRPQNSQRGHLRPRADRQAVDERLDIGAGDLIDGNVAEPRFDAQFPVLGVAAPGLRRHRGLLGFGELRPDSLQRCVTEAWVEPTPTEGGFVIAFGFERLGFAQSRERA